MIGLISQSPGHQQALAPRVFHPNRHAMAARVFGLEDRPIEQALAARVLNLAHHAIERGVPRVVYFQLPRSCTEYLPFQ